MKGTDANIEIIKSSQLQILKLPVEPLKAKIKIAYIFVMTKLQREDLKPLIWNDAKTRALAMQEFLKNDFKYDTVEIHTDLSKEKIVEKIRKLEEIAGNFSATQQNK